MRSAVYYHIAVNFKNYLLEEVPQTELCGARGYGYGSESDF